MKPAGWGPAEPAGGTDGRPWDRVSRSVSRPVAACVLTGTWHTVCRSYLAEVFLDKKMLMTKAKGEKYVYYVASYLFFFNLPLCLITAQASISTCYLITHYCWPFRLPPSLHSSKLHLKEHFIHVAFSFFRIICLASIYRTGINESGLLNDSIAKLFSKELHY